MDDADEVLGKREYDVSLTYKSDTKERDQAVVVMPDNTVKCTDKKGLKCIFVEEFGWDSTLPGELFSGDDTSLTLSVTVVEEDGGNPFVSARVKMFIVFIIVCVYVCVCARACVCVCYSVLTLPC